MRISQIPFSVFLAALSLELGAFGCTSAPKPEMAHGGFTAVIASDAAASSDWYANVLNLEVRRELPREGFQIYLLRGEAGIVEIIEFDPPASEGVDRSIGLFKAGFIINDFDSRLARWRETGVEFLGDGKVFTDDALDLRSVIILDPDGNRIQIFGARP